MIAGARSGARQAPRDGKTVQSGQASLRAAIRTAPRSGQASLWASFSACPDFLPIICTRCGAVMQIVRTRLRPTSILLKDLLRPSAQGEHPAM